MIQGNLTIGQLAAEAGVHVETVRYYQRRGLLPEPSRGLGTIRRYERAVIDQLRFIKRTQAMGFTLAEASKLLDLKAHPSCGSARALAATKLDLIDLRIEALTSLRTELIRWVAVCDANTTEGCCPTLDTLAYLERADGVGVSGRAKGASSGRRGLCVEP